MLTLFNSAILIVPVYLKIARIKEKWIETVMLFCDAFELIFIDFGVKNFS